MKLVYKKSGIEVRVGDLVVLDGEECRVTYFRPPHKPESSGKVTLDSNIADHSGEFYVSVIGAEWIEREDRDDRDGYEFDSVHGRAGSKLENAYFKSIKERILNAMQEADEMGGPEGLDYIDLMTAISKEALQRAQNCIDQMQGQ